MTWSLLTMLYFITAAVAFVVAATLAVTIPLVVIVLAVVAATYFLCFFFCGGCRYRLPFLCSVVVCC